MAINIKISTSEKPLLSNELIYKRMDNQTPLDLAISYFENGLEDLFSFYSEFNMTDYRNFYNTDRYRILKELNPMRLNQFESATKAGLDYFYTQFDGINEYIDCGNDNSLNFERTDSFTISGWINPHLNDRAIILSRLEKVGIDSAKGYGLQYHPNGKVRFILTSNGGSNGLYIDSSDNLSPNVWSHILVTYDGSSTPNGVKIYVNGVSVATSIVFNSLVSSTLTTNNVEIASFSGFGIYSNTNIDEVSIYNAELNATEVLDIYNKGRKNPLLSDISSIISHWRMDNINPIDIIGSNNGTGINIDSTNIIKYN